MKPDKRQFSSSASGNRENRLFLHAKQMEVFKARFRFKVVTAGRRWGKTQLAKTMLIK